MRHAARIVLLPLATLLLTSLPAGCTSVRTVVAPAPEPIALERVPVEYGFGRRITSTFALAPADWAQIQAAFTPPARTAAIERGQIREAVALMETFAGRTTPAGEDRGRNATVPESMGQMDCINESTNTTRYLTLFQQEDLLRHHAVLGRAYRSPILLDAHYSAQILDVATGQRYVVDSWLLANGLPPVIQPVAAWGRKEPPRATAPTAVTSATDDAAP